MKISAKLGLLEKEKADLLVVNLFEGVKKPPRLRSGQAAEATGSVDRALGGLISKLILSENFQGEEGETLIFHTHGQIPAQKVLIVGLGKEKDFNLDSVRQAAGISLQKAAEFSAQKVVSILHGAGVGGLNPQESAQALCEGALLASYRFLKYKNQKERKEAFKKQLKEFLILQKDKADLAKVKKGILQGQIFAKATLLVRDLVNEPSSHYTPVHLKKEAQTLSKKNHQISVKVFDQRKLKSMGAGGLLGVAKGSEEPAYLIHLHYKPQGAKTKIALVGKGITFDTGGISLKPSEKMEQMKIDMAGAGTILGVFSALPKLRPKVEVHGVIATCENMPSGRALKPGDIVHSLSGKTIEIFNTDAEGRVILADALTYAQKQNPNFILDLATLTGACLVALGEQIAGAMGNNPEFMKKLQVASKEVGEKIWELPLPKEYQEGVKSDIADLKNIPPTRFAGAIMGGLFLQEFVGKTPWIHLDIAGPVFAEKPFSTYIPQGGTGFGVRTILRFLEKF